MEGCSKIGLHTYDIADDKSIKYLIMDIPYSHALFVFY